MKYNQGRLIDHVAIHVADLEVSRRFYRAIFGALEKLDGFEDHRDFFCCDELYVGASSKPTGSLHLAFQADSIDAVHAFHAAGLAAGGTDNGGPGYRHYHPAYYAAFLLDPDGNNVEALCDVGATRNAESIVITRPIDGT